MADFEVEFELNPLPEMEADFEISVLNNEHDLLIHRDYENQHPISAIEGLTEALAEGTASVEAEAQARIEADNALQTAIDDEVSRATEAESQLSSEITAENQRALQAESALDVKIEAETTRAEGAESSLQSAISNETTTRAAEITRVEGLISAEESRATNAEEALNAAISRETEAREQADTTLQANITAEETRANGVESGLRADLTAETTARETADSELSADILAEKSRAEGVEASLDTAIQNEVIRATTAEQSNATAISNHIADKSNPHEVTKAQVGLGNVDNTSDLNKPISNAVSAAFDAVEEEINTINSKIPNAASSTNQLADKDFVNSSISTNTANFIGTFNSVAELEAYSGTLTNNDYAFVVVTDSSGNTAYDRYKWNGAEWLFEYELNNSSFTAAQWTAINSTATEDKINQIAANAGNITTLELTKQDNITSTNKLDSDLVDDNGQTNKFVTANEKAQISTNASDISALQSGKADKATTLAGYGITDAYTKTEVDNALSDKQNTITDLATIRSNATAGKSASDTIATYGNIVTHNISEFATSEQGALADTAVQPDDLASVATSGSYNDLTDKPTIGNATLTIQKNGAAVDTFTANATADKTINITVPINNNELTNGAGYQTAADVQTAIIGKQDVLSAGNGISIANNTVSIANPAVVQKTDGANTYTLRTGINSSNRFYTSVEADNGGGGSTVNVPMMYSFANGGDVNISTSTSTNATFENVRTVTLSIDKDSTPTSGSTKPVTSGGVYAALQDAGGNYTAGTGIDITNNQISVTSPTLINKATGRDSLSILGNAGNGTAFVSIGGNAYASGNYSVAIGGGSVSDRDGTAIGSYANATTSSIAIGSGSVAAFSYSSALGYGARTIADSAIQIGQGMNIEANSMYVSTSSANNWKLLGSDGLIPDARISSNIARTTAIASKADTDLSNLTSDGSNIANWSSNVTNCITEIPQDIKLELNNGTITLKAGSKVYVPNGFESDGTTPKFDEYIAPSDISQNYGVGRSNVIVCLVNNNLEWSVAGSFTSGATQPSDTWWVWYDTTSNKIKFYNGSTITEGTSFPICIITENAGSGYGSGVKSIDQVFNGFGYIGSTVFALPGVKGLIPNGRNADGSLKSTSFTVSNVLTLNTGYTDSDEIYSLSATQLGVSKLYLEQEDIPNSTATLWYKPSENKNYRVANSGDNGIYNQIPFCFAYRDSNSKITSFTPKTSFHALDYNDSSTISGWAMPSDRYINLTLGATGATYTAPANGWLYIGAQGTSTSNNWIELVNISSGNLAQGIYGTATWNYKANIEAKKGNVLKVEYLNINTSTAVFRFIYAEGEWGG